MNAQVSLLQGQYNLIHFPLEIYTFLVQPIIRTLIPQTQAVNISHHSPEHELDGLTPDHQHRFLNISITPIEVSIVCHASWARNVFQPIINRLPRDLRAQVSVSADTYLILCVIAAGLDPAGRVMELSSPLALAGIPIFFITTYYSDFILAPTKERVRIIDALSSKGFELLEDNSFINRASFSYGGSGSGSGGGSGNGSSKVRFTAPDQPPDNVAELQRKTFELLQKRNIAPSLEPGLELLLCGGRDVSQLAGRYAYYESLTRRKSSIPEPRRVTWADGVDSRLFNCIVSALASQPRFLSVTLAQDDPPSVLMDKKLLSMFGDSVVGDFESTLIPIFLNLENLPSEVTGVVSGVAGRLVQDMKVRQMLELSYLSTAKASAVVLPKEQAERALSILDNVLNATAAAMQSQQ